MDSSKMFFIGRKIDQATGKATTDDVYYDPADLTTHGIVTGMTGSGKTGLCVGLLEEAALQKIPAIIIDPKGDLTNLLLHFPDQQPKDFQPWVDPDAARKANKTVEVLAEETAKTWSEGLASWGIGADRISALADSVQFTIYTPGSDAGVPVSILASLKAPDKVSAGYNEVLMEKIGSTVSALLGLVGITDVDPVRSREHILLTNIFQHAWSQGKDLDLSELILQTQNPPFDKLGVFPLDKFYPENDRMSLAMLLNNFLASPSFQIWMAGEGLDIGKMLYSADGEPRHSIFYIAHLSETERMFFITLLYSSIEGWMRQQTGTSGLRALVYFDEIMGYLPPVSNPPSKQVILRLLKQARAFGVGLLLATQNPVDVDYKALSNAGTWFIGKLQTDQDKQRLLDGLEGVAGGMDRNKFDQLISSLGKRVFLLHNVHESNPVVMQTRWAMNYLAGPLARIQIPALNQLAGTGLLKIKVSTDDNANVEVKETVTLNNTSSTRPSVPKGINEYFMPNNLTLSESAAGSNSTIPAGTGDSSLIYRPALVGLAQIRYLDRRYGLDTVVKKSVLISNPDKRGMVHWKDFEKVGFDTGLLNGRLDPRGEFHALEQPLGDVKTMGSLNNDFEDWLYQTGNIEIFANNELKEYAPAQIGKDQFLIQCKNAAQSAEKTELDKLEVAKKKKVDTIQAKLDKEVRELARDKTELNQRTAEEVGSGLETVLGLLGGRKRSVSKNLTKRRMTANAKADVDETIDTIADLKKQLFEIENDFASEIRVLKEKWNKITEDISSITVVPTKTNIFVDAFGVIWLPYYQIQAKGEILNLPGYKVGQ